MIHRRMSLMNKKRYSTKKGNDGGSRQVTTSTQRDIEPVPDAGRNREPRRQNETDNQLADPKRNREPSRRNEKENHVAETKQRTK